MTSPGEMFAAGCLLFSGGGLIGHGIMSRRWERLAVGIVLAGIGIIV